MGEVYDGSAFPEKSSIAYPLSDIHAARVARS